jgi:hypothetical protein
MVSIQRTAATSHVRAEALKFAGMDFSGETGSDSCADLNLDVFRIVQ